MKLMSLVFLVLVVSSCNSGSSSSGTPQTPEQILQGQIDQLKTAPSATDYPAQIKPNAVTMVKEDITYEEQKEKYQYGCSKTDVNNPSKSVYEMDKDLKMGSQFKQEWAQSNILKSSSGSVSVKTITFLSATEVNSEINYESIFLTGFPFTSIGEIFNGTPHVTSSVKYDF